MCGINGIVNKKNGLSGSLIRQMNNLIKHRGPDSSGVYELESDNYSIAMGMRRLSIIDLSNGNQPIYSKDKTKVIVFNGEIYNFQILKEQLLNQGCTFETNSDTEVVLKLYEKEGVASFGKLDGMFAFSIFDITIGKVFIARDYFGEKPLYYALYENSFIWASELKSLLSVSLNSPEINVDSLSLFFRLTYIPAPFTIYQGVFKLEPNNFLEYDCNTNNFSIFEIKRQLFNFNISSKNDAIRIAHDLVRKSVYSRSISDVPIGTFLSGGVDSSIISLCLAQQKEQKIETFSIGFEKKSFDESSKSDLVSKLINSKHHKFTVTDKDLTSNLDQILLNFDEPFADSSALATYILSIKTKDFVKVALTGDGGDEVFGGYNKYYMGKLNQKYTFLIPQKIHINSLKFMQKLFVNKEDSRGVKFKFNKLFSSIDYNDNFYYNIISLGFSASEIKELFLSSIHFEDSLNYFKINKASSSFGISDFRAIDRKLSLEGDLLVKVDRTSMLASLECRAPFLNSELWDFTNQLPDNYLINGWDKKHILKEAFKKYFPTGFLDKSKRGFEVPVGDWLRSHLRSELLSYIDKTFIDKQNIFQYNTISDMVINHINGKVDNTFRVWAYFSFQKWYMNIHNKITLIEA